MGSEQKGPILAIVDDDDAIRRAVQDLLEAEGKSVWCCNSAEQFLGSRVRHGVACLIADIRMPGMSGMELQERLQSERSLTPIIFITALGDIPMAVRALHAGAIDFLTKPISDAALLVSVEKAYQRHSQSCLEASERYEFALGYESLTPREREVLALLLRGLLNKQAAFELGITEYTVQVHRANVMRKMRASSFATLIQSATKFAPAILPRSEHSDRVRTFASS
jgi:FixJ family two-component response regulator